MFLYELAMELDLRSTELAADATRLGMGEVGPTTNLTREQVAALRSACTRQVSHAPGPAMASGPALAAPDGWGRPASSALLPGTLPPPVAPTIEPPHAPGPLPPPPPPPVGVPHAGPPPAPHPPQFTSPGTPPASPANWGTAPAAPGTGPVGPPEKTWRDARGQLAAIGVVVLLVVALFVYMAVNSGPDTAKEKQLRAEDRRAAAEPVPTLAPTTSTPTPPEETTVLPGSPQDPTYAFADLGRFCTGARGTAAFELRVSAGAIEGDWQALRRALIDGRADWRRSVDDLAGGAPPYLAPDIGRYRTSYEDLISGAESASSAQDIQQVFSTGYSFALRRSAKKINSAVFSDCRGG